jgi:hypothetical protein
MRCDQIGSGCDKRCGSGEETGWSGKHAGAKVSWHRAGMDFFYTCTEIPSEAPHDPQVPATLYNVCSIVINAVHQNLQGSETRGISQVASVGRRFVSCLTNAVVRVPHMRSSITTAGNGPRDKVNK